MEVTRSLGILIICFLALSCGKKDTDLGSNRKELESLSKGKGINVSLEKSKDTYQVEEELDFKITSSKNGKAWVLSVSPDDKVTLVFPNAAQSENEIDIGEVLRIPPDNAGWLIRAHPPAGKHLIVVIVTRQEKDAEEFRAKMEGEDGKAIRKAVSGLSTWGVAQDSLTIVAQGG